MNQPDLSAILKRIQELLPQRGEEGDREEIMIRRIGSTGQPERGGRWIVQLAVLRSRMPGVTWSKTFFDEMPEEWEANAEALCIELAERFVALSGKPWLARVD